MKVYVIGLGGAGNKAIVSAIKSGVINKQNCLLMNTTLADIEEGFEDISMKFGSSRGGCGKERNKAKSYMIDGLRGELANIKLVSDEDIELVILVSSTEGGTGSGSTMILAKYINQVLGKPVQIFAFAGFEEDGRGLKNTVEFFQESDDNLSIQCTSNSKFLNGGTNKIEAEKASNLDFINRLRVIIGHDMVESEQNIDATDLFKVSTQPGYTVCNRIPLTPKVKNVDQYNKIIKEFLDTETSLDTNKTVKRLAIIFNIAEETTDNVDFYYNTFKDKFGMPFEVFTHVQHTKSSEYVDFIASGLDLPIDEVREVYDKYKEQTDKVNKKKDSFLNESNELKILQTDDMFDVNNTKASISSDDFFKSMGVEATPSTVEVLGEGATGVKVIKHKEFLDSLSENN